MSLRTLESHIWTACPHAWDSALVTVVGDLGFRSGADFKIAEESGNVFLGRYEDAEIPGYLRVNSGVIAYFYIWFAWQVLQIMWKNPKRKLPEITAHSYSKVYQWIQTNWNKMWLSGVRSSLSRHCTGHFYITRSITIWIYLNFYWHKQSFVFLTYEVVQL